MASLLGSVCAQEIPRPSVARQKVKQNAAGIANFKVGEVALRVDARMSAEYIDNINLTPDGVADFAFTPQVGVTATWAMTKMNTLRFRASLGYTAYLNTPELNQQLIIISPDSALNFDIYSGDFRINFHEQFSIQQDPITQGGAAGIARLGIFTNTAGIAVLWDTNDIIWSFGYDNLMWFSLGGANNADGTSLNNLNQLDHFTNQLSASASFRVNSATIAGIETTASYSDYPKQEAASFGTVSLGSFIEFQLTKYTHMFIAGGYNVYSGQGTAPGAFTLDPNAQPAPGGGSNSSGYYWSVAFVHRLNRFYSDRLEFGRQDSIDAINGRSRGNFVRYTANFRITERLSLGAGLFADDTDLVTASALGGSIQGDFWRVGATLSTGFQLTEKLDLGLGYQFTKRQSERPNESFTQNRVTISVGYRF